MTHSRYAAWKRPLIEALLISALILGLFYYWYGVANRSVIFLYSHTTVGIPYAEPFDEMTSSRYWMAGLVATGIVMILYTAVYWLLGRLAAWRRVPFVPSPWWRVWGLAAVPLAIGIPAITMTVNAPTLPFGLAAACVVATLLGLAVALLPGAWAAERPVDLLWLLADGLGMLPVLVMLRIVELPGHGLSISYSEALGSAIGWFVFGVIWLSILCFLRVWRHREMPGAAALFLAGVGIGYGLTPLLHFLLFAPAEYRYITTASNVFAFSVWIQLLSVGVAAALAVGVAAVRRRLSPA